MDYSELKQKYLRYKKVQGPSKQQLSNKKVDIKLRPKIL